MKEKFKSWRGKLRNLGEVWKVAMEKSCTEASPPRRRQNLTIAVPLQQPPGQSVTAWSVSCTGEILNNMERAALLW